MSNPAVTKLCRANVGGLPMWMDDNIGESIHIHIGDFRVDLSYKELEQLCEDLCITLNALVDVDGFDFRYIDPVYFQVMLKSNLLHLKKAEVIQVDLENLLCPVSDHEFKRLPNSRGVKALRGDTTENDVIRASHHIGQSSKERLDCVYESIKNNGYPLNNNYIIVYGNDNIIQDGQHRASCLWDVKGNITVPVLNLEFDNYQSPHIDIIGESDKAQIHHRRHLSFKLVSIKRVTKKVYLKIKSSLKNKKMEQYMRNYGKLHSDFVDICETE